MSVLGKKIVTIGGGTGQFHMLKALLALRSKLDFPIEITAIPTTSDSGSSSGVIRLEYNVVAPGDISQCMFGLHPEPELVGPLFGHRFSGTGSLKGHSLRNMIVLAYFEQFGATQEAMDKIRDVFRLDGRITPITFSQSNVHASLKDGTTLASEDDINNTNLLSHGGIDKLWLEPAAQPNQAALQAIREADVIIVCPGTLACSIVPNFLVEGVLGELKKSKALKIYVANLMNRRGHVPAEWSVLDYVQFLEQYLGENFFNAVICNTQPLSTSQTTEYQQEKIAVPLVTDMRTSGRRLLALPLLMNGFHTPDPNDPIGSLRSLVRHDPEKVARAFEMILTSM